MPDTPASSYPSKDSTPQHPIPPNTRRDKITQTLIKQQLSTSQYDLNKLSDNITKQITKNREKYNQILQSDSIYQRQLYQPQTFPHRQSVQIKLAQQIMLKQLDILLQQELVLKKQLDRHSFVAMIQTQTSKVQLERAISHYSLLRELWVRKCTPQNPAKQFEHSIEHVEALSRKIGSLRQLTLQMITKQQNGYDNQLKRSDRNYVLQSQQYLTLSQKYQTLRMQLQQAHQHNQQDNQYYPLLQKHRLQQCLNEARHSLEIQQQERKDMKKKLRQLENDYYKCQGKINQLLVEIDRRDKEIGRLSQRVQGRNWIVRVLRSEEEREEGQFGRQGKFEKLQKQPKIEVKISIDKQINQIDFPEKQILILPAKQLMQRIKNLFTTHTTQPPRFIIQNWNSQRESMNLPQINPSYFSDRSSRQRQVKPRFTDQSKSRTQLKQIKQQNQQMTTTILSGDTTRRKFSRCRQPKQRPENE